MLRKERINELKRIRFNETMRRRIKGIIIHSKSRWEEVMVGMGGDVIDESVHVGREGVVSGMGFTVEERYVLVVILGIVPNV